MKRLTTSLNFHHINDRETGSTVDGGIFNYESIDAEQVFQGEIKGEEDDLKKIYSFFGSENILNLGRSKSTQYGKIKFELVESELKKIAAIKPDASEIQLNLLSDTVIYNDYGTPEVSKKIFENYLNKLEGLQVNIEKAFIKAEENENYLSVWKLKTPAEKCFKAGSSFKIKVTSGLEKIVELSKYGIGENLQNGYGQFNFTTKSPDEFSLADTPEKNITKPMGNIPILACKVLSSIISQRVLEAVRLKAVKDKETFLNEKRNKGGLSNSLIGRLESFVKGADEPEIFFARVKEIKKLSKDKLESLVFDNDTFYNHLISKNSKIKPDNYLINDTELRNLAQEINYSPDKKDLELEVFKEYWLTFFNSLRKTMKVKGGRNGR